MQKRLAKEVIVLEYCMLETASDNKNEINKIAKELLDKELVASCHIIESESSWNWNNERENSKEYLLQMKTKKKCLKEIYEIIKSIHSYECFEFAVYNITSINEEYLKWIDKEVKISDNRLKLFTKFVNSVKITK